MTKRGQTENWRWEKDGREEYEPKVQGAWHGAQGFTEAMALFYHLTWQISELQMRVYCKRFKQFMFEQPYFIALFEYCFGV